MTPRLSYTNIAILGLIQIGVVVFGVLGAGAAYKTWSVTGLPHNPNVVFASEYGFLFLVVPLSWITIAIVVQGRNQTSDSPELITFLSGALVLLILVISAWKVAASPLIRSFLGCGGLV